jgi:hypothetical protein
MWSLFDAATTCADRLVIDVSLANKTRLFAIFDLEK